MHRKRNTSNKNSSETNSIKINSIEKKSRNNNSKNNSVRSSARHDNIDTKKDKLLKRNDDGDTQLIKGFFSNYIYSFTIIFYVNLKFLVWTTLKGQNFREKEEMIFHLKMMMGRLHLLKV